MSKLTTEGLLTRIEAMLTEVSALVTITTETANVDPKTATRQAYALGQVHSSIKSIQAIAEVDPGGGTLLAKTEKAVAKYERTLVNAGVLIRAQKAVIDGVVGAEQQAIVALAATFCGKDGVS
jgi:hypothetical protein